MLDYKKIITQRTTRQRILSTLSFIPDKPMLKIQYRIKTGRRLNLKAPQRFTEKIQWYKLNYKNPLLIQCADKCDVREYVESKGLKDILIPCYGVFESPISIPWADIPDEFVMKDTLGGGGNSVVIVRDKNKASIDDLKNKAESWVKSAINKKGSGREWPYYSGKRHRVIIEKLLTDEHHVEDGINDYKIYCFNGVPYCINVDYSRFADHKRNYYDTRWRRIPVESNYPMSETEFPEPENFDQMLFVARTLSESIPFVRVDLYNIDGVVYFSEMTFFPASGYMWYKPDQFDYELGKQFILPEKRVY